EHDRENSRAYESAHRGRLRHFQSGPGPPGGTKRRSHRRRQCYSEPNRKTRQRSGPCQTCHWVCHAAHQRREGKMKTKSKSGHNNYVIIMAGGRGERFWPVSREKTPKQLLTLLGDRSFLQQAVDRVMPIVPAKNIFII